MRRTLYNVRLKLVKRIFCRLKSRTSFSALLTEKLLCKPLAFVTWYSVLNFLFRKEGKRAVDPSCTFTRIVIVIMRSWERRARV